MSQFNPAAYHVTVSYQDVGGHPYFVGTLAEFPDIRVYEDSFSEAVEALMGIVQNLRDDAVECGVDFPAPFDDEVMQRRRADAYAAREQLDFVLEHGLPMARDGHYRYHGVKAVVWHTTQHEAIIAAMAEVADNPNMLL
jgi:hypothetical protein